MNAVQVHSIVVHRWQSSHDAAAFCLTEYSWCMQKCFASTCLLFSHLQLHMHKKMCACLFHLFKQHWWHQHRDLNKRAEASDCHKLQVPRLSYKWWGLQAWDTLQDSADNSSIDKVETSLEWQEYFFHFQDTTDALPCHIHLPVCFWIMDFTAELQKRIQTMEMRCYCKILPISYKNHVTIEEVRAKIQQAIGPHKDLLTIWPCLPFIRSGQNYLARCSERGKKTRQTEEEVGRQYWEWTGLEVAKSRRAVENREEWRKLVAKSSVVPQWPSRLRDRWW